MTLPMLVPYGPLGYVATPPPLDVDCTTGRSSSLGSEPPPSPDTSLQAVQARETAITTKPNAVRIIEVLDQNCSRPAPVGQGSTCPGGKSAGGRAEPHRNRPRRAHLGEGGPGSYGTRSN